MFVSDPTVAGPQRCPTVADFLHTFFHLLDESDIRYCVLHDWDGLADGLPSDLDLAMHPEDAEKLPTVIRTLYKRGYLPIQMLHYAVNSYRYDFAWPGRSGIEYAGIDITYEYREGGLILISGSSLVADRRRRADFWVASPATEFAYVLAKKACKGTASVRQQLRLKHLVEEVGSAEAGQVAGQLFGKAYAATVVEACKNNCLP